MSKEQQYWIHYRVEGFGEQTAGPYSELEVNDQARDIRGYEGVSDVSTCWQGCEKCQTKSEDEIDSPKKED